MLLLTNERDRLANEVSPLPGVIQTLGLRLRTSTLYGTEARVIRCHCRQAFSRDHQSRFPDSLVVAAEFSVQG